jgi:hypothetical protein
MRTHQRIIRPFLLLALVFFLELSIAPLLGVVYGTAIIFFPAFFFVQMLSASSRPAVFYAGIFGILRDSMSLYPPGVWVLGFVVGVLAEQLMIYEIAMDRDGARFVVAALGVAVCYGVVFLVIGFYNHAIPSPGLFAREMLMNGFWVLAIACLTTLKQLRFSR